MNTQMPLDLPPSDTELLGMTTCDNPGCQRGPFPLSQVLPISKHTGHASKQFHFCGETCANEFYLERLRSGM